jgi:hypothetical protein
MEKPIRRIKWNMTNPQVSELAFPAEFWKRHQSRPSVRPVVETSPFRLARRSAGIGIGIGIGMRASMRRTGFGPTRACPVSSRRRFLGQRTSPMP